MLDFLNPLRELNTASLVLRLLLTTLCAGAIGFERGYRGRAAGMRTHIIVALGASVVMVTNQYICDYLNPAADPARLGAQVINGIGFLGAGTIMVSGNRRVVGLTTAAGLWGAACIGLSIGIGFYEMGFLASALIIFTMTVLHKLEDKLNGKPAYLELLIELSSIEVLMDFVKEINHTGMKIKSIEIKKNSNLTLSTGHVMVLLTVKMDKEDERYEFVSKLGTHSGVVALEEL